MVMIKDSKGIERYSLSQKTYDFALKIREKILKNDDMVLGVIYGSVGCGKSVFAQHLGMAIDPTLEGNVKRTAFDKREFIDAILENRKAVIIGDEGISLFFRRGVMTKEGRLISELMDQCRQKNLCVLICVPKIMTLDSNVLETLTEKGSFICYVWESIKEINGKKVPVKGNVKIYPNLKNNLYAKRVIDYKIKRRKSPFIKIRPPSPFIVEAGNPFGENFKKVWYPVSEDEYKQKKESILDKYRQPKKEELTEKQKPLKTIKKELLTELIISAKKKNPNLTDETIAKVLGYTRQHVNTLRNHGVGANGEDNT